MATPHEYVIRSVNEHGGDELYKHLAARPQAQGDPVRALDTLMVELHKRYPTRVFQVYRLADHEG